MSRYVIEGGQAGYDRLTLLARTRQVDTAALLERVGVRPGWRCVDLGCGSGDVAFLLAGLVGPTGHVDGIDADDAQLTLVRHAVHEAGIGNIQLHSLDISAWTSDAVYDLVYARFVLQHLPDPLGTLSRMWAAVKPGGALVVEDADFAGLVAYPPDEGYDFYARNYRLALAANGGDPIIGQKLFSYFRQIGVADAHLLVTQGVHAGADDGKQLPLLTLRTTGSAIVAAGLASAESLASAEEQLSRFVARPDSMLSGPRIFQVWGHRTRAELAP